MSEQLLSGTDAPATTPVGPDHVAEREPAAHIVRRFVTAWQGIVLSLIGIVATVWLGINGQLGLYIHPRYFSFTIIMAVLAAGCAVAACVLLPGNTTANGDPDHSGHDDAPGESGRPGRAWAASIIGILTIVGAVVALLVLPPHTLTGATATQRSINAGVGPVSAANAAPLAGGDSTSFSVRDWAILIRQNPDSAYLREHSAQVTGFVLPSQEDPDNLFYVARFIITCCAVDAQPVGVPVYLPGWQSEFQPDSWVSVTGSFSANPVPGSLDAFAIIPDEIGAVDVPEQPYVY
ncbi:hypothetical protein ASC66_15460 [Leifsonia sp. Root4]|uniref:TIGR03943 family putative permease subunit n=1 Tax=Leifsonia sp. Root4 TaxID=1736525 RepID=UPI0006F29148|nr:TIGR03943 family protein [Leifsonia sp. Root4]KQW05068.1 hypothetical protein ASC66_15460 [Leifsonia sp. Root4]